MKEAIKELAKKVLTSKAMRNGAVLAAFLAATGGPRLPWAD